MPGAEEGSTNVEFVKKMGTSEDPFRAFPSNKGYYRHFPVFYDVDGDGVRGLPSSVPDKTLAGPSWVVSTPHPTRTSYMPHTSPRQVLDLSVLVRTLDSSGKADTEKFENPQIVFMKGSKGAKGRCFAFGVHLASATVQL